MARRVPFDEELPRLTQQVAAVQSALRAALEGIASDESGARACGRALGLTRSLGWSIWNMAFAPDTPAALRAMPGDKGWKLLNDGLVRRGCPPTRVGALTKAVQELRTALRARNLHPTLLRSIASGALDTDVEARRMVQARKKAREAAEVLYGIRSALTCSAMVIGPPDADGIVDVVGVLLFDGLARLRPGPEWPIFEGQLNYGNSAFEASQLRPSKVAWALDHLCTPGTVGSALRPSRSADHLVAFADTGAGSDRGIRAAFGQRARRCGRVTRIADSGQPNPHVSMIVTVPTKVASFDVLVHRAVPMHAPPAGALYGPPDPWPTTDVSHGMPHRIEAKRLPLEAEVEQLTEEAPPAGASALRQPWSEMLALAVEAVPAQAKDFRRFRLTVKDPPMHGRILMRWVP
jgi:hypothetical protein